MSTANRAERKYGGVCSRCEHDLVTGRNGKVYCSNANCTYATKPHKTGRKINAGGK